MHDLILRNRVAGYREGDLMRHLHGDGALRPAAERSAFEHHHPETGILVAFPVEAWPHLLAAMRARTRRHGAWSGKLTTRETALATHILEEKPAVEMNPVLVAEMVSLEKSAKLARVN